MKSKVQSPKTKDQNLIEWGNVKRILVIRLRSIGDTVLTTPSLIALRRFLPDAEIDILLEDWVAPVLDGFDSVDNVISVGAGSAAKIKTALTLRRNRYDAVFNLHGGTTAGYFTLATGAPHRFGFSHYSYPRFHNHLLTSSADFWKTNVLHSAEQQLALLGFAGVPVEDLPKTRLAVSESALASVKSKFAAQVRTACGSGRLNDRGYALLHPTAAFETKTWPVENFAQTAEFLSRIGLQIVAVAAENEKDVLSTLAAQSSFPIITFSDLSLSEITALASKAKLFVGNDSGIAHIAAAVNTPSVVIFGSSNRTHWRPWTDAPNEIVFEQFPCQPCPGDKCRQFGEPRCILSVTPESVFEAIDKVLEAN